jgi:hypothetical protein
LLIISPAVGFTEVIEDPHRFRLALLGQGFAKMGLVALAIGFFSSLWATGTKSNARTQLSNGESELQRSLC